MLPFSGELLVPKSLLTLMVLCSLGCQQQNNAKPAAFERIGDANIGPDFVILMWIDPAKSTDIETIKQAVKAEYPSGPITIIFWSDRSKVPSTMPKPGERAEGEIGRYVRRVDGRTYYLLMNGDEIPIQ
jgi:hypothetical protein